MLRRAVRASDGRAARPKHYFRVRNNRKPESELRPRLTDIVEYRSNEIQPDELAVAVYTEYREEAGAISVPRGPFLKTSNQTTTTKTDA